MTVPLPVGFPTRKLTWIYAVGVELAPLLYALRGPTRGCETLWSTQRSRTPPEFRDVLLAMARGAAGNPPAEDGEDTQATKGTGSSVHA